jgi:hypothetical protein
VDRLHNPMDYWHLRSTMNRGGHGGISLPEHKLVGNSGHRSSPRGVQKREVVAVVLTMGGDGRRDVGVRQTTKLNGGGV